MADAHKPLIIWGQEGILAEQMETVAGRLGYSPRLVDTTEDFFRYLASDSANVCIVDTRVASVSLATLTAILEATFENGHFALIAVTSGEVEIPETRKVHLRVMVKPFALTELESILSEFRDLPDISYGDKEFDDPLAFWFGVLGTHLRREQREPRMALKLVSDLTTAKELQALLSRVITNVRDVVHAERVVVFLLNDKKTEIQAVAAHGLSHHILNELRFPLMADRLVSVAVRAPTRGIISIGRAPAEPILEELLHPTECAVTIPLEQVFEVEQQDSLDDLQERFAIVHIEPLGESASATKRWQVRRCFGALYFDNPYSRQPVQIDDYTVLEMVIRTSAMVINDILLAEGLNRRVMELGVLREASERVSQTLDVHETLQAIIRAVTEGLKCERGSVMLLEKGELVVRAYSGTRQESILGKTVQVGEGLAGWVVENRKPLLVKDLEKDPVFHRQSRPSYMTRSAIIAPLELEGELLGVINVSDKLDGTPFDEGDLALLVAIANHAVIALKNARLYGELKDSYFQTVRSLAQALDAKDPYTKGHSDRVAEYTVMIAKEMADQAGIPPEDLEMLRVAGILHDVGKIGVPESVLLKPGRLSEEEFKLIQKHAEQGDTIVRPIRFLDRVRGAVRSHHERYAGGGYPDNLVGDQIPLYARIMAVADAFDAMTTSRSYRKGLPVEEAVKRLEEGMGSQFDPAVVQAFKSLVAKGKIQPIVPPQD
ncbi:MAG: HD domain-containing phosphohydrolase [bacterium JZ-2024 1]